jgi:cell filamentation protein
VSEDPYVYPGTDVLINKEDIRDRDELAAFERLVTANRLEHLPRRVPLTYAGYRRLHRHIFAPVYAWAGQDRTVNLARGGSLFCLVPHIAGQMAQRFAAIRAENGLRGLTREAFAMRAAEHLCELNAIHPFREGNGRTLRALLVYLAEAAGHHVALERIDPEGWNSASIGSFRQGDYDAMRRVILGALVEPTPEPGHPTGRPRGRGRPRH